MANTATLYRATAADFEKAREIGDCWTTEESVAVSYIENQTNGVLISCELCIEGLTVVEVAGYDRDENYAIGDTKADIARLQSEGVDVITYDDEDLSGESHRTWRIISEKALAALRG